MLFESLNKYQREAVLNTQGPIRIVAGPGSGKTRTIIAKTDYILKEKLAYPHQILILTFTNKAGNEIKRRLSKQNEEVKNVFTFHSFAAYFLRVEAKELGIDGNYIILDRTDQKNILKREMKDSSFEEGTLNEISLSNIFEYFSKFNSKIKKEENFSDIEKLIYELYKKYKLYKKRVNAYDFDDLLINLEKILNENEKIKEKWVRRFKYIFVDEFQDVNKIQYSIIKKLTNKDSNITVVGDPDQNIYSWRGSDISYILNFEKDFHNVKTIILKINYRSTGNIIDISNRLITHNKNRVDFEVENIKDEGAKIRVAKYKSKYQEAEYIANEILNLFRQGIKPNNIAIIYRANYLSLNFERAFASRGIKYRVVGGLKFFDREEIKRMIYFIRFLIFQDDFSFLNIINFPARKFGAKSIEKLDELRTITSKGYWDDLKNNQDKLKLKSEIRYFIEITENLIKEFNNLESGIKFNEIFKEYLKNIGFLKFYEKDLNKTDNISNFFEELLKNFSKSLNIKEDLIEFLNQITLLTSNDNEDISNHVTLITAHAAKGTEYKVVFLVSFNQKIFPSYQALDNGTLEEERRVAYVAITRAKELLYISYTQDLDFASEPLQPSVFLSEMLLLKKNKNQISENKRNFFKRLIDDEEDTKNYSSLKRKENYLVKPQSIIIHKKYGEGIVIFSDNEIITVAFDKKYGIKKILKNHASWYLFKK